MKMIIGLGNPGNEYEKTRHNVGYLFINYFEGKHNSNEIVLKKTDSYMNDSGSFVSKMVNYFKIKPDNLYIVHDDLDIPLGEYKIQFGIGPKDHNGINDIESKIATKEFWRVRIGIDNRDLDNRTPGEAYVLQKFNKEELNLIDELFEKIKNELEIKLQ